MNGALLPQAAFRHIAQGLRWGWQSAGQLRLMLAELPPGCSQAIWHAASVCSPLGGRPPSYFAPGFGPWELGYGWMGVGILVGLLMRQVLLLLIAACEARRSLWRRGHLQQMYQRNGSRQELLDLLIEGGPASIRELASDLGEDPHRLLLQILQN